MSQVLRKVWPSQLTLNLCHTRLHTSGVPTPLDWNAGLTCQRKKSCAAQAGRVLPLFLSLNIHRSAKFARTFAETDS